MEQLRRYGRAVLVELPWMLALTAGTFALGTAVTLLTVAILRPDDFGMVGGTLSLVGIFIAILVRNNLNPHTRLFLALSMGQTRRDFLVYNTLYTVVESLLLCGLAWVLCHVELGVYRFLLPGMENDFNILGFFRPVYLTAFTVGLVVLNLLWTALMGRFGVKGFLFTWLPFWLILMLVGPAIDAAQSGKGSLLALLGRGLLWVIDACSSVPWQALLGAALLLPTAAALLMLRKIPVKL